MIQEIFETLGFKEEEVKTYLALLDTGARTAGDLAKVMGTPRPTLYGHLEKLMTAGLVTQSMRRGVKIFVPEPAEKLRFLYKRKIEELRGKEKSLDAIIPELEKRSGINLLRPRMNFFEGKEGMESAMEDILMTPAGTMTYTLWPIRATMDALTPDFFRYHNLERIKRDIHIQGIWPRTGGIDISRHPYLGWGPEFKRELRYAPLGVDFVMGYWVYGHKVMFLSSRAESYGFIMESAELAQMMATQHQIIWKISEPIPFDKKFVQGFLKESQEY